MPYPSAYEAEPMVGFGVKAGRTCLRCMGLIPSALYDDPRVAAESSCRRRSVSTSFPAVISKDVDGGPPPAMTITTNRRVNDFGAWY